SETDRIVERITFKPKERFQRLLEDSHGWAGIEEISKQAPKEFLASVWPAFVRAVRPLLRESTPNHFADAYALGLDFGEDHPPSNYPLPSAIDLAIRGLAGAAPEEFLQFYQAERASEWVVVQRLLSRGLAEIGTSHPEQGLQFLVGDPRRLELGPHS